MLRSGCFSCHSADWSWEHASQTLSSSVQAPALSICLVGLPVSDLALAHFLGFGFRVRVRGAWLGTFGCRAGVGHSAAGKGSTGKGPRREFRALASAGQRSDRKRAERERERPTGRGHSGGVQLCSGFEREWRKRRQGNWDLGAPFFERGTNWAA